MSPTIALAPRPSRPDTPPADPAMHLLPLAAEFFLAIDLTPTDILEMRDLPLTVKVALAASMDVLLASR